MMQLLSISQEAKPTNHGICSEGAGKNLVDLQSNMLNYALKLTANKNKAKELNQETILKVLENLDKYYDNINFKGWVLTIMHNLFINNYHQTLRKKTVFDQANSLYLLNLPQNPGLDNPERNCYYSEITKALRSLKGKYKTPFTLYLTGYSYSEIAKKLNVPLGTVKSRLFVARKQLQIILVDYQ